MGFYKFSCHSPPFSQLVSIFLPLPVNMSVTPACEILNRNSKNYMCSFWKQTLNPVQMKSLVVLFCNYPIEFHLTFQCTGGLLSPWARSERQIFFKKIWIVTLYTSVSPLHMKTYDLIRAGGLSLCPVWLTTNIVPGIFFFFFSHSLQPHHLWRICYIFWAGGGWGRGFKWFLCGASIFKLRN